VLDLSQELASEPAKQHKSVLSLQHLGQFVLCLI